MVRYYSASPPMEDGRCGPNLANQMPYYNDRADMYGTLAPPAGQGKPAPSMFVRGQRKRMNIVSIALSLFMPWLLFSSLFAVLSFSLHYEQPSVVYLVVVLGAVVVLVCGAFAADTIRKQVAGTPGREPTWFIFLFITSLLAWMLSVVFGDLNFYQNMQPFYDVLNLNFYDAIDPSLMRGQQLMDAGRIVFAPGAKLDLRRSIGFKNVDLYCVAPVTMSTSNETYMNLASYDFWAVGINCCSGNTPDFQCGAFNDPRAHAGLRLMRDDQRGFFRLAVQQAEAAYSIKAVHPLFLYWMQDPIAEVNGYKDEGFKYYLIGMFSHFTLQLFLVVSAAVAFARMGYS